MEEFLKFLIGSIIDHPQDLKAEIGDDDRGKVAYIYLNEEDRPLVIGRQGNNIKAIRELSSIIGRKTGERVYIKIQD